MSKYSFSFHPAVSRPATQACWLAVVLGTAFLSGCASTGTTQDRFEPVNRKVHAFNRGVDKVVFKPLAQGYVWVTPDPVERGISNVFNNLRTPWTAVNQVLQGKPVLALEDSTRFLLNSTLGLGGLIDVGADVGLEPHREDFGQTLAVWGVPSGHFIVVPFIGPTTFRDVVGPVSDRALFPPNFLDDTGAATALNALDIIQLRAQFLGKEQLIRGDEYLFIRDAWLQKREYDIADGEQEDAFLD